MDADRLADRAAFRPSSDLVRFIRAWEGCRLTPYKDVAGLWTVGVGHLMQPTDSHDPITSEQADILLTFDLCHTADSVSHLVTYPLTQSQADAICSFAFNVGVQALHDSTLLRLVNMGQLQAAAFEFPKWSKARVNGVLQMVEGLMRRRAAEREMFLNGVYQGP